MFSTILGPFLVKIIKKNLKTNLYYELFLLITYNVFFISFIN